MGLASITIDLEQRVLEALQRRARPSTLPKHLQTGLRGEQEALFFLRRQGFTIVAQRWTSAKLRGDLDLVGWDGSTLVIFEVKTRSMRNFAPAEAAVDENKRRQLRLMARAYLRQLPAEHRDRVPIRFDVVSVYLLASGVECEHLLSAFSMRG